MSNTLLSLPVKMVRLGDIAHITYGKGLPVKDLSEAGYPVFGANGVIGFHSEYMYAEPQVLISCRGAASGTINMSPEKCFITNNSLVVSFDDEIVYSKALFYLLQAANKKDLITGSAQPQVTINNAIELKIPLFTYTTQKNIVTKIEELFSELDSGIASLKTAQEQLKIYRQALLKHAFEGKLTEQWRKDNADKLETPEQLLTRIQTERETRYQQQLDEWKQAVKDWEEKGKEGKKPSTIKKLKSLGKLDKNVLQTLNELPSNWCWGKVGSLSTSVEYGTSAKSSETGDMPVIRMGNMQGGKIDWGDLVYTSDEEEIKKYRLSKNDVLFNRTNSPEWVGKTVKYSGERPAIFAGYLIRINYVENIVNPDYLNYFLNSQIAKNYGNTVKTDGVNQSNINGEKLQHYPFPFCSLAEQQEIVNQLEEKLSIIEQNEKEIEDALAKAELLRQSILKKAFSGMLTNFDSNMEIPNEHK